MTTLLLEGPPSPDLATYEANGGGAALRRARRWQAYRSAPMGITQRACAGDITRGSLRAWATTRGRS